MTAFDLAPSLKRYAVESEKAARALVAAVEQAGTFDPATGRVTLDKAAFAKAARAATKSKPATDQLVQWTQYLADGGLASVPAGTTPALIPWRSLEDIVAAQRGTPPGLREFMGVDTGTTARRVVRDVHERFPDLPQDVFGLHSAPLLPREPALLPRDGGNGGGFDPGDRPPGQPTGRPPGRPTGGGIPVIPPPVTADVGKAVDCFKNATYTGLDGGTGWFSWFLGFRVCFDHTCTQEVGETVLSFASPGVFDLIKGLYALIQAGLVAALEGFLSWVTVIITMAIATLGLWITTSDNGNGVCLCFMWSGPFWVAQR